MICLVVWKCTRFLGSLNRPQRHCHYSRQFLQGLRMVITVPFECATAIIHRVFRVTAWCASRQNAGLTCCRTHRRATPSAGVCEFSQCELVAANHRRWCPLDSNHSAHTHWVDIRTRRTSVQREIRNVRPGFPAAVLLLLIDLTNGVLAHRHTMPAPADGRVRACQCSSGETRSLLIVDLAPSQ
jgi:hypothetical protein